MTILEFVHIWRRIVPARYRPKARIWRPPHGTPRLVLQCIDITGRRVLGYEIAIDDRFGYITRGEVIHIAREMTERAVYGI